MSVSPDPAGDPPSDRQPTAAPAAAATGAPQQLERLAGLLMVALGLWLGRQAILHLTALPAA